MRYALTILTLSLFGCGEGTAEEVRTEGLIASELSAANAPVAVFNTTLRSENEINGSSTSDSRGFAQLKVHDDGTVTFLIVINNKDGETYTRAHLHKAAEGANGGIHWDFLEAGNPVASLTGHPAILRGTARPRAVASVEDLLANPELYYVNVHSTAFPGGSLRGQLP